MSRLEVEKAIKELERVKGIQTVLVNGLTETMLVKYRPGIIDTVSLVSAVKQLLPLDGHRPVTRRGQEQ